MRVYSSTFVDAIVHMSKLRWLTLLMLVTILAVTSFQVYWLKENYNREEKTLGIKAEMTFRETMLRLQASKLKLGNVQFTEKDIKPGMKVYVNNTGEEQVEIHEMPRPEIISSINIIQNKISDSLQGQTNGKVKISMNREGSLLFNNDSLRLAGLPRPDRRDVIFNFLYGVDSLQDSIRVHEIDSAYTLALSKQKLPVPFIITRRTGDPRPHEPVFNQVTIGIAKPVTYKLQLGRVMPYLLQQIFQPILFSIGLLGITILSFVLLYRNLLRQQRLSDLKNEFISNITHELKTPIATVGVAIEALKNFNAIDNPKRTREYLDISQNELQRLSLLVDKVLKLSMFEKQGVELKFETLNLEELVTEVTESLKLQLEKYNATLTVHRTGDVTLQGDRLHLLSVIFNLLDNALKYGKENPVVEVNLKGDEKNVQLSVSDNGIGIPPEYKHRIFEKFFRVPHGDTHNAKGYGLGLSYTAQVVQRHQGTIEVETEQGRGTEFIITLPKYIS